MPKNTYLNTRRIALGGMMAALSMVILIIGNILGIGMYAAPMLAGLCLLPVRREMGARYQLLLWLAVSLLSFMLVSNIEQNLMYLCLFGLYPAIRPWFQKRRKPLQMPLKLLYFNVVVLAVEAAVLLFFAPEVLTAGLAAALLILGNLTFLCYDFAIPVFDAILAKRLEKLLHRAGR